MRNKKKVSNEFFNSQRFHAPDHHSGFFFQSFMTRSVVRPSKKITRLQLTLVVAVGNISLSIRQNPLELLGGDVLMRLN